jgi:hypothetical protein
MTTPLVSRFAVGADGFAHSGTWRVWTRNNDLYCGVRVIADEVKASVHAPRPPDFPDWKRHWGFDYNASSEVANSAIASGGRHKATWPGFRLADGWMLEWRFIFQPTSLRKSLEKADPEVTLLPVPKLNEQVEVVVITGPMGGKAPRLNGNTSTTIVAEGDFENGAAHVWVIAFTSPLPAQESKEQKIDGGHGHIASTMPANTDDLRGFLVGVQADGSLAFWDRKATFTPNA